jgi:hypothetical protein
MITTLANVKPLLDHIMTLSAMDEHGFIQFGSGYITQKGFASLHDYKRFQNVDTPEVNDMPVKLACWGNKEDGRQFTLVFLPNGEILEYEGHPDDHVADITAVTVHGNIEEAILDTNYD